MFDESAEAKFACRFSPQPRWLASSSPPRLRRCRLRQDHGGPCPTDRSLAAAPASPVITQNPAPSGSTSTTATYPDNSAVNANSTTWFGPDGTEYTYTTLTLLKPDGSEAGVTTITTVTFTDGTYFTSSQTVLQSGDMVTTLDGNTSFITEDNTVLQTNDWGDGVIVQRFVYTLPPGSGLMPGEEVPIDYLASLFPITGGVYPPGTPLPPMPELPPAPTPPPSSPTTPSLPPAPVSPGPGGIDFQP